MWSAARIAHKRAGQRPERQFLKLRLQLRQLNLNRTEKASLSQVSPESGVSVRGLFSSNPDLASCFAGENIELQCINEFQPIQPTHRERRVTFCARCLYQLGRLAGFRKAKIEPGEQVAVGRRASFAGQSLSTMRLCAAGIAFGNSFASRARKLGAVIRSGPASGRIL